MATRTLSAEDVGLYREIRLESLKTDPAAFGSNYEREAAFDDATWLERLCGLDGRPVGFFVDEVDGEVVGTAGVIRPDPEVAAPSDPDDVLMLIGMWVRPSARGTGSGRRLVDAASGWAVDRGAAELMLWVVKENAGAIRLYESCGFERSGLVDTLPSDPCVDELEMRRPLP